LRLRDSLPLCSLRRLRSSLCFHPRLLGLVSVHRRSRCSASSSCRCRGLLVPRLPEFPLLLRSLFRGRGLHELLSAGWDLNPRTPEGRGLPALVTQLNLTIDLLDYSKRSLGVDFPPYVAIFYRYNSGGTAISSPPCSLHPRGN
jgi:hypothetical protein